MTIAQLLAGADAGRPSQALVALVTRLAGEGRLRGIRAADGRPIAPVAVGPAMISGLTADSRAVRPGVVFVAVPGDSPWNSVTDLPQGVKVSSEYPEMTRRYFEKHGVSADIQLSYGATEANVSA